MHTYTTFTVNLIYTLNLPLCSPRNTNLNFLKGFPKSPAVDMTVINKPWRYFSGAPQLASPASTLMVFKYIRDS